MARCVACGVETELYVASVPICPACADGEARYAAPEQAVKSKAVGADSQDHNTRSN
jgi:hypothetical protein